MVAEFQMIINDNLIISLPNRKLLDKLSNENELMATVSNVPACLISKIESLRPDEVAVLKKMDSDVFSIKPQLKQLQHFQRRTDVVEENSLELEILVKELREAAQESEDAIDNFLVHLAHQCYIQNGGKRVRMYAFVKSILDVIINSEASNVPNSGGFLRRIISRWSSSEDVYSPLIILDDVWSVEVWSSIKIAFPENNKSSRVMLTTRSADVAFSAGESIKYIHNLQPLSEEESWKLFCNKIYNGPCPENLIQSSQAILKKCGGLPLAIVTISGVLISKNQAEPHNWNQVNGSLGAELEDNRRLRSTYKILSLSYNVLPYHLKACFLYMSIFPEDHLIERLKLIRLWMAEGFLIEIKDMALEDVGESYLTDLVNRNLVQVAETSSDGRMKTCYVHDLLREIIKVKSKDQNFVTIAKEGGHYPKNVRRLSLQNSLSHFQHDQNLCQLRSLLMFEVEEQLTNSSIPSLFSGGLKLLTVLDLQGASLKKFPSAIVNLFNLRYLSLKDTQVKTMPNSIGMLQKLQTLDLKNTLISKIPNEILKLQQLRNLLIYRYKFETYTDFPSRYGFKAPSGIRSLTFLRKLCSVEGGQGTNIIIRELEILTQLRRLVIIELIRENGPVLCSSIEKLKNLHALSISAAKDQILDLQYIRHPPEQLRRLYLTGRLESLPAWISSLEKLTKIFLKSSRLQVDEDPLKTLEDLPNLVHVEFLQVCTGTTLNFKADTFKKLRILGLHEFESLETVKIEDTALPNLERFVINSCAHLKTLPEGINKLSKLRVLDFITMPAELISAVQLFPTKGTDYDKLCHIPEVNHIEKKGSILVGWSACSYGFCTGVQMKQPCVLKV